MHKLNEDEEQSILKLCCTKSLNNMWSTCKNWKKRVEEVLQGLSIIDHHVDTRMYDWLMRYAINLRMPPIFALGPKLGLEKAVQLFAKFDHLFCKYNVCMLAWL